MCLLTSESPPPRPRWPPTLQENNWPEVKPSPAIPLDSLTSCSLPVSRRREASETLSVKCCCFFSLPLVCSLTSCRLRCVQVFPAVDDDVNHYWSRRIRFQTLHCKKKRKVLMDSESFSEWLHFSDLWFHEMDEKLPKVDFSRLDTWIIFLWDQTSRESIELNWTVIYY